MRSGNLRTLARIQRPVESDPDGMGSTTVQWTDIGNVWIDARPHLKSGAETVIDSKLTGSFSYMVVTRYRTDIDATMRFVFGRMILQISAPPVDPDGRRVELNILCENVQ